MGKSIRSKIKVRLRTAKRQRVDAMIITPRVKAQHEALKRVIEGRTVNFTKPRNAFKYPSDPTSVFPQHEIMKPIDFRSSHLPMASYAFRGNRRKYEGEQAEYMQQLAKTSHPEMQVLAGGGAILSSGKHVSMKEAEILATAARNPDAVAAAVAESAPMADAAAASVGDAPMEVTAGDAAAGPAVVQAAGVVLGEAEEEEQVPEPVDAADHSRIPVLKDTRRAKRTAEHRPRSNAVKKKTKIKVQSTPAGAASSSAPPAAAKEQPAKVQQPQPTPQQQPAMAPTAAPTAPQADADQAGGKTKKKGKKKGRGAETGDVDMA